MAEYPQSPRRYARAEDLSQSSCSFQETSASAESSSENNQVCDGLQHAEKVLKKCIEAIEWEVQFTRKMQLGYFERQCNITMIEDTLLSLASYDCIDGIFLCCIVRPSHNENSAMGRFFEFGAFSGFYHSVMQSKTNDLYDFSIYPYQVYTGKDVEFERERHHGLYANRRKSETRKDSRSFSRKIFERNTTGVSKCLTRLVEEVNQNKVVCDLIVCFILNQRQKWEDEPNVHGNSKQRFYFCTERTIDWAALLMQHRSNPLSNESTFNLFSSDINQEQLTLEEQMLALSALPNHHKWVWPGKKYNSIKFEQHFSTSIRWSPGSPRNRIIQSIFSRDDSDELVRCCLKNVLGEKVCFDYGKKRTIRKSKSASSNRKNQHSLREALGYSEEEAQEILNNVLHEMGREVEEVVPNNSENASNANQAIDFEEAADDSQINDETDSDAGVLNDDTHKNVIHDMIDTQKQSLYQYYCSELFRHGIIAWRVISDTLSIVVLNAYHCETGDFLPNAYVHTEIMSIGENVTYHCSCETYSTALPPSFGSNQNLDACCHCRLLKELTTGVVTSSSINHKKVHDGKLMVSQPVIQLASKSGVDRFSVVTDENVSFLTLFNVSRTSKTIVKCHSSICKMREGSQRNIKLLSQAKYLCPHITEFRKCYMDQVTLASAQDLDENTDDSSGEEETEEDTLPNEKWEAVFDADTGLWNFGSTSPSQQTVDDDPLSENLRKNLKQRDGNWKQEFCAKLDGSCDCGAGWSSPEYPEGRTIYSHDTNLYTDTRVLRCKVYSRMCMSKTCRRKWDGATDSVFQLSTLTCAGYELGWEFVSAVMNGKMTFSGFVSWYSERYNLRGYKFMDVSTFIKWFFAWSSGMRIDFRQGCPGCDGPSPILACDGTKIGMGFKNTFVSPIEAPTKDAPTDVKPSRFDRCFMTPGSMSNADLNRAYATARVSLRELCNSMLSKLPIRHTREQLAALSTYIPPSCRAAFDTMISDNISPKVSDSYATVFRLLSYDSSLDAIFPYHLCNICIKFVELCESGNLAHSTCQDFAYHLTHYSTELAMLVSTSTPPSRDILELMKYCSAFVKEFHSHDVPPEPAIPIASTYNPPKFGRAYYFTEHGQQVREIRRFPIDNRKEPANFDNTPDEICCKKFPQVSKKGVSYLFLWFCPKHGHCLGFHVIPGSEGRKDPASSLYGYCEVPPGVVFYDFTCSLSEYAHNRESGFFRDTRFFHDVFHGYTHKCSPAFKCERLLGFECVNTSICEQFNSFLQRIKASAKLMSQCHFAYYVQFFIHIWNRRKAKPYMNKLKLKISGADL